MNTSAADRLLQATRPRRLLVGLVLLAGLLIAGDVAFRHSDLAVFVDDPGWNARRDRNYIELAGYLQGLLAAMLLAATSVRRGRSGRVLGAWAAVVLLVVVDDAFLVHERGGEALVEAYALPSLAGLRAQDLGELIVWAALGLACLALLGWAHAGSGRASRRESWRLGGLLVVLAVFAVGVDMKRLVVDASAQTPLVEGLVLLEAAGELLALSFLLVYALVIARRDAHKSRESQGAGARRRRASRGAPVQQ